MLVAHFGLVALVLLMALAVQGALVGLVALVSPHSENVLSLVFMCLVLSCLWVEDNKMPPHV